MLASGPAGPAGASTSTLIWYTNGLTQLHDAHRYELVGTRLGAKCHYAYPELTLNSANRGTWVVQDIAIDAVRCVKLVVEGNAERPDTGKGLRSTRGDLMAADSFYHTSRYRQRVGRRDALGVVVAWDETRIQWSWDGSCSLGGTTYQYTGWATISGWVRESASNGYSSQCVYYYGTSRATFRNDGFCSVEAGWTDPVYAYVYYNRIFGRANGSVTLQWSSDHSTSCIPLPETREYGTW